MTGVQTCALPICFPVTIGGCRGLCFVSLGLWCDSFGDFTQLNEGWGLCFLSFLCAVWVWWAGGGFVGSGGGTGLSLWLCGCDSEDNNTFNIIWEKYLT